MTVITLVTIGVALVLSLGLTRLMIVVAPKLGLLDQPGERRVHTGVIPRAGGIAVWVAFVAAGGAALFLFPREGGLSPQWFTSFVLGSGILLVVGVLDDRFGMSAWVKLGGQAGVAVLLFFMKGGGVGTLMGYAVPWWLDLGIWVAWTVGIINAFNLIDGMDGLCAGLGVIAVLALATIALARGHVESGLMALALAGALLGFLRYNLHPARIFLGDAGSMFVGLFVASAATEAAGERAVAVAVLVPLLIAGVPLFDVILAVWRRTARTWLAKLGAGKAARVFGADKDHLHHRLLAAGLTQRKVAGILYVIALFGAVVAILPSVFDERALGITIAGIFVALLVGFRYVAPVELQTSGAILHLRLKRPSKGRLIAALYFGFDTVVILVALALALTIDESGRFAWLQDGLLLPMTALTVACGLLGLRMAKAHSRHWSRAGIRDFWALILWFLVGMQVAFTLTTLVSGDLAWHLARVYFMTAVIGLALMAIPRSITPLVREAVIDAHHRRLGKSTGERKRVVLYGGGDLGELFLHHLKTTHSTHLNDMRIVGFLDDNANLRRRVLDGFRIHGSVEQLPELAERLGLHGVVITMTRLDSDRADQLNRIVEECGLTIYRWRPQLHLAEIESHEVCEEELGNVGPGRVARAQ